MSRRFFMPLASATAGLALIAVALGLAGTRGVEAQEPAIDATVQAIQNAWNTKDVGSFIRYFTDAGFEAEFGFSKSNAGQLADFIGDPPITLTAANAVVTGDTASADVTLDFVEFTQGEHWDFVRSNGRWQVDNSTPIPAEIPEGATVVDVQVKEYSFTFDAEAIKPGDEVAFTMENVGQEDHELVLVRLTSDAPLLDLLQSEDEEGIEFLVQGQAGPGQSNVVVPPQPLTEGRYALVCFFSSPDGTPHAFLGMTAEFNVGSGGAPISPPNTGDGGLIRSSSQVQTGLGMVGGVILLSGLIGLAQVRMEKSEA